MSNLAKTQPLQRLDYVDMPQGAAIARNGNTVIIDMGGSGGAMTAPNPSPNYPTKDPGAKIAMACWGAIAVAILGVMAVTGINFFQSLQAEQKQAEQKAIAEANQAAEIAASGQLSAIENILNNPVEGATKVSQLKALEPLCQ